MRCDRLVLSGFALLLALASAEAAPLSCEQFRDRLNGALIASASQDAEAPSITSTFRSPTRGKRYDWSSGSISGSMNCGPADQFEEFYVTLQFAAKDQMARQLRSFVAMNGAAICSLAADTPINCINAGKVRLQDALRQMGAAYKHGSSSPSGLTDRPLFPGVNTEATSAATLITFLVGPGRDRASTRRASPSPRPISRMVNSRARYSGFSMLKACALSSYAKSSP